MNNLSKNKIFLLSLVFLSFTSCDSSVNHHKEFYGEWKSEACQEGSNSKSFLQYWNESKRSSWRKIRVWNQPNCPANIAPKTFKILSYVSYQQHNVMLNVSSFCANGKAIKRKVSISMLLKNDKDMVKLDEFSEIKDPELRASKQSQKMNKLILDNIGNVLPKYDLICLDDAGRLRIGNLSVKKDGSTESKRPVEMNSQVFFIKQIE